MLREKLEQWTPTAHFQQAVDFRCAAIDSADYFCSTANQWLRDAYLAARFASYSRARTVRLVPRPARYPDFEVQFPNGKIMRVEATEVDLPGRRRGDEYRNQKRAACSLMHDPDSSWERRRDAIIPGIKGAVERKSKKDYPPGTSLMLYVNLGTYGAWQADIERQFSTCADFGSSPFTSVWALWGGRLYRCWPNPTIAPRQEIGRVVPLGRWRDHREFAELFGSHRRREDLTND